MVSVTGTFDNLFNTDIISLVSSPTETAAYNENGVILYSCMCEGLEIGSAIVIKKSCACSANGENDSRIILMSFGDIHKGLVKWSGFNLRYEKSDAPKDFETASGI